jgi:hypothetical protein
MSETSYLLLVGGAFRKGLAVALLRDVLLLLRVHGDAVLVTALLATLRRNTRDDCYLWFVYQSNNRSPLPAAQFRVAPG